VYKNSLFVFGGYNGQVVLNTFYEFRFEPVLVPPPSLLCDLRALVNNESLSDVAFLVEGLPVFASRIHLASRSEHFRAMLFGGMREAFLPRKVTAAARKHTPAAAGGAGEASGGEGEELARGGADKSADQDFIVVEDVSHAVFVKMLEFLYTDDGEEEGDQRRQGHGLAKARKRSVAPCCVEAGPWPLVWQLTPCAAVALLCCWQWRTFPPRWRCRCSSLASGGCCRGSRGSARRPSAEELPPPTW
jgi:hypothetical protein